MLTSGSVPSPGPNDHSCFETCILGSKPIAHTDIVKTKPNYLVSMYSVETSDITTIPWIKTIWINSVIRLAYAEIFDLLVVLETRLRLILYGLCCSMSSEAQSEVLHRATDIQPHGLPMFQTRMSNGYFDQPLPTSYHICQFHFVREEHG